MLSGRVPLACCCLEDQSRHCMPRWAPRGASFPLAAHLVGGDRLGGRHRLRGSCLLGWGWAARVRGGWRGGVGGERQCTIHLQVSCCVLCTPAGAACSCLRQLPPRSSWAAPAACKACLQGAPRQRVGRSPLGLRRCAASSSLLWRRRARGWRRRRLGRRRHGGEGCGVFALHRDGA